MSRKYLGYKTSIQRRESLEDPGDLPSPGVIAAEVVEDLQAALAEFTELAESLQGIGA